MLVVHSVARRGGAALLPDFKPPAHEPAEAPTDRTDLAFILDRAADRIVTGMQESRAPRDPLLDPCTGGFKLKGAEGRIRQDILNRELEELPQHVWAKFESLVTKKMERESFAETAAP